MVKTLIFISYIFCHFALASLLASADFRLTCFFSAVSLVTAISPICRGKWQLLAFEFVNLMVLLALCFADGSVGILWSSMLIVLYLFANYLFFCTHFSKLPEPLGPFKVGFNLFEFKQLNSAKVPPWRHSKHSALGQVYIWYPVSEKVKGGHRAYQTSLEGQAFSSAGAAFGVPRMFSRHLQLAKSNAIEDADIADVKCPLVMFNHGNAMWPSQNMALMELLASHGYCVVSLSHHDESSGVAWSNGEITPMSEDFIRLFKQKDPLQIAFARYLLSESVEQQRQILEGMKAEHRLEDDYRFLLTELWADETLSFLKRFKEGEFEGLKWLNRHVDFTKVGYMGMSLGGSVASECGYRDENASFVVNLDGMYWNIDRINQPLCVPLLQLSADPEALIAQVMQHLEKDNPVDSQSFAPKKQVMPLNAVFYQSDQGKVPNQKPVIRLTSKHASHMTFTDKPLYIQGMFKRLAGLHMGDEKKIFKINRLILDFVDKCCSGIEVQDIEESLDTNEFIRQ